MYFDKRESLCTWQVETEGRKERKVYLGRKLPLLYPSFVTRPDASSAFVEVDGERRGEGKKKERREESLREYM